MNKGNRITMFRAEQLCIMHFTRSNEIKLVRNFNDYFLNGKDDPNLDLLFDINDDNFYSGFSFGVTLKAIKGQAEIIRLTPNFKTQAYKEISLPVVLIVFDVSIDKGSYSWINLPIAYRNLETVRNLTPDKIKYFNSRALKDIVAKVNLFYKA
jgi:hypothetical protein